MRRRLVPFCAAWLVAAVFGACDRDPRDPPRLPGSGNVGAGGSGLTPGPTAGSGGELVEEVIADPAAPCDQDLALDDPDPYAGAAALGLCKRARGDDDWGILEARYTLIDGSEPDSPSFDLGHGLLPSLGRRMRPFEGESFLALSSGTARPPGHSEFVSPAGFDKAYISEPPFGFPKESPSCDDVVTGLTRDDIALELVMRAPPEARSLAFQFTFFTFEWPVYVCSEFNDFMVALLEPFPPGQPDGNISFDQLGNPVSVNNALVRVCSCADDPPCQAPPEEPRVSYDCELGDDELEGTGFELHAATSWLVTRAPVTPGEIVKLRIGVFDSGDGLLDSTTLVDGFRWLANPIELPETEPGNPQ
jgi:hypothetical protein